jgi:hypothetical protein
VPNLHFGWQHDWACTCPSGTTGPTCTELVNDPCATNDCSLAGSSACVVTTLNSFGCRCKPGYTGDKCDVDIDECCSSPCTGVKYCVDGIDSFQCRTPNSFAGCGGRCVLLAAVLTEIYICNVCSCQY